MRLLACKADLLVVHYIVGIGKIMMEESITAVGIIGYGTSEAVVVDLVERCFVEIKLEVGM